MIILPLFLQALVNLGEILKAAGCGYENGNEEPFMSLHTFVPAVMQITDVFVFCSRKNHGAPREHERLHQRKRRLQAV